jgi:hypothetical protein
VVGSGGSLRILETIFELFDFEDTVFGFVIHFVCEAFDIINGISLLLVPYWGNAGFKVANGMH